MARPPWRLNAGAEIDVDTAYPGIYSPNPTSMFADHTFLNQYPGNNNALLAYCNGPADLA